MTTDEIPTAAELAHLLELFAAVADANGDNATATIQREAADRLEALQAQVDAVRGLHQPFDWSFGFEPVKSCKACVDADVSQEEAEWPCLTIRALDGDA